MARFDHFQTSQLAFLTKKITLKTIYLSQFYAIYHFFYVLNQVQEV